MTSPEFAKSAARALARSKIDDIDPPSAASRADGIAAIEGALRDRRRARFRNRMIATLSMAAVVVLASTSVYWRSVHPAPLVRQMLANEIVVALVANGEHATVISNGNVVPLAGQMNLVKGNQVVTPSGGSAMLHLATGTELSLDSNSGLTVLKSSMWQKFSLDSGSVYARVAKLSPIERFIISTEDAEVEVRGTAFRVTATREAAGKCDHEDVFTRVDVDEGVVTVRHGESVTTLRAGQSYPAICAQAERAAESVAATALPAAAGAQRIQVSEHPVKHGGKVLLPLHGADPVDGTVPTLAEQNEAFADAVALRRAGNRAAALSAFEHFLERFPRGPLTESAVLERLRLIAFAAPTRAHEAAESYLRDYPHGSGREDAQKILEQN